MTSESFTTEESSAGTAGSISLLLLFMKRVPFLRWVFIPNVMLACITSGGYQVFLWLSGRFAECSHVGTCSAVPVIFGLHVTPSLLTIALIALALFFLRTFQWNLFETGGQFASRQLLRDMVHGVACARTTFFDEYPSGKIINRIVKDSDSLRLLAPMRIGDTVNSLIEVLVIAFAVSFASPLAAALALPILLFFMYVQYHVAPMLQHLMVLRSARFGEVLHRESDVIEGVRTFTLYNQLPALTKRLTEAVYRFMQMHFLRGRIEAWGRLLCDIGLAVYGAGVVFIVHLTTSRGVLEPAIAAVIITASLRLGSVFAWLTWAFGQIFESAGHARRVFEYVNLPEEESEEGNKPSPSVSATPPLDGDLSFINYTMSYRRNTPEILTGLNLTIAHGSKVGLVGRTGSGKSSLVQSLFRMVYVRQGDISVGSVSLLSLDIHHARELFAVVPQDPYLFEGTIRTNLDRLAEHTEAELHAALRTVRLSLDLNTPVIEGGRNLSFGERQLICLARVILSKRPFVIMDEPTSGVDTITDAVMQSVLRTALHDRTIITIAHRLETLTRMDRIIELCDGKLMRDGRPDEVLPLLSAEEVA